ncbi:MAG: ATP-binding cassette domain-containing protein [Chromatiales bacterium]|nr:ATP-binding cassette domain-containing protein [Chromatiales bacterium]
MPLLTLHDIELGFGSAPLLERVSLTLEPGERVCLLGRNGAGKSTLLNVIAGTLVADSGARRTAEGVRVGVLPQNLDPLATRSVGEALREAFTQEFALIEEAERLSAETDARSLARLDEVHKAIDAAQGWAAERQVNRAIDELAFPPDTPLSALSGGQQRRVLLRRAMLAAPQLLILDEPTNHLDIDAIDTLTSDLLNWRGTLLFTTHDRRAIDDLATRIVELDRGQLTSWPGDFKNYLRRREERESAQALEQRREDKRLAEEEVWIRQGVKARRTRNEGRVRRLIEMRKHVAERRSAVGTASFGVARAERSGKRVSETAGVDFGYGDEPVIRDLSVYVERGDRIGIIGPNGAGKTTLLKVLLGELSPTQGTVELGTKLAFAYLDQTRAAIAPTATVYDAVADGSDHVELAGERRHVISYLGDFLFPPNRVRAKVSSLSGGERARLSLAKVFAKGSNLLVLDEPTNDLDLETLELLEERLIEYSGTLLVVSHDRAFLDHVVTSTMVIGPDGHVDEFVGGYSDWIRQRPVPVAAPVSAAIKGEKTTKAARSEMPARPRKLSFKVQRELQELPASIEALEGSVESMQGQLADPALYRERAAEVPELRQALASAQTALEQAYERWSELEDLTG